MKEIEKIIALYDQIDFSNRRAALATVIHVEGSAYRRPGARMLITDDGRWQGSISGGCLEGDALRKARRIMADGKPAILTYDTLDESSGNIGASLGCNGIIHVFVEPILQNNLANPIEVLRTFVQLREPVSVATIVHSQSENLYRSGQRFIENSQALPSTPELFREQLSEVQSSGKSFTKKMNTSLGSIEVFFEFLNPGLDLLVFGAGPDTIPLTKLATELGWQVTVTEDCIAHLAPKKFAPACRLVFADKLKVLENFSISSRSAAVLVSHNFEYDVTVLEQLIQTEIPYIGIMGPLKRFLKMQSSLASKGFCLNEELLERIHAPIGLDIGAETPEEIAVSVLAEIKAVFAQREAGFLKSRKEPIHDRAHVSYTPLQTYLNRSL